MQQTRAEFECYMDMNEALDADIRRLKEEKQMLEEVLNEHKCCLRVRS